MSYHSNVELLSKFEALRVANPKFVKKTEIGQSVAGNPILMYSIGNPFAKSNMVNVCHGDEHIGSECQLMFAQWLLDSIETLADEMLFKNCWRLIPMLNVDNYGTGTGGSRKNRNRVDLNRNFVKSWRTDCVAGRDCPPSLNIQDFVIAENGVDQKGAKWGLWHNKDFVELREGITVRVTKGNKPPGATAFTYTVTEVLSPCKIINLEGGALGDWNTFVEEIHNCQGDCIGTTKDAAGAITRYGKCYKKGCVGGSWSDFPEDYNYRGSSPGSEPETKALKALFESIKPRHFLDIHAGDGVYFARGSSRAGLTAETTAKHLAVATKIRDIQAEMGITTLPYYQLGILGSATDDAFAYGGAVAYLTELNKTLKPAYSVVLTSIYKYFFSMMKGFHLMNQE